MHGGEFDYDHDHNPGDNTTQSPPSQRSVGGHGHIRHRAGFKLRQVVPCACYTVRRHVPWPFSVVCPSAQLTLACMEAPTCTRVSRLFLEGELKVYSARAARRVTHD